MCARGLAALASCKWERPGGGAPAWTIIEWWALRTNYLLWSTSIICTESSHARMHGQHTTCTGTAPELLTILAGERRRGLKPLLAGDKCVLMNEEAGPCFFCQYHRPRKWSGKTNHQTCCRRDYFASVAFVSCRIHRLAIFIARGWPLSPPPLLQTCLLQSSSLLKHVYRRGIALLRL